MRLVESIVNHRANVNNILSYIKENYNIDGIYNEDDCTITINRGDNDAFKLAKAKDYIESVIGEE